MVCRHHCHRLRYGRIFHCATATDPFGRVCVCASLIFSDSPTNLNLVAVIGVPVVVLTCHSTTETQKTHKMTEMSPSMYVRFLLGLVLVCGVCASIAFISFAFFFLPIKTLSTQWFDCDAYLFFFFYSFDFIHFLPVVLCSRQSQRLNLKRFYWHLLLLQRWFCVSQHKKITFGFESVNRARTVNAPFILFLRQR